MATNTTPIPGPWRVIWEKAHVWLSNDGRKIASSNDSSNGKLFAEMAHKLNSYGVLLTGYDVLLAERDRLREQNQALVEALERYVKIEEEAAPVSSSPLRKQARGALAAAKEQQ